MEKIQNYGNYTDILADTQDDGKQICKIKTDFLQKWNNTLKETNELMLEIQAY